MYEITIDGQTLYKDGVEELAIVNPKLELEVNSAGSLEFTIYPNHPLYEQIYRLRSRVIVYRDGEAIWRGRVLSDESDWLNGKTVTCEGELAYLNDSIVRPWDMTGEDTGEAYTIREILEFLINTHNSDVDEEKRFTVGEVSATTEFGFDTFGASNNNYETTWENVSSKLIDELGGYLFIRYGSDGTRYLDYLADADYANNLLLDTQAFTNVNSLTVGKLTGETYNGLAVRYYDNTAGSTSAFIRLVRLQEPQGVEMVAGQTYTLSFWCKGTGVAHTRFYDNNHGITKVETSQGDSATTDGNVRITLSSEWEHVWLQYTVSDTATVSTPVVHILLYGGNEAYICGMKLENGLNDHPTWFPSKAEGNTEASQRVRYGFNLLDISHSISGEDLATVVIPLGATDEETSLPITIATVTSPSVDYVEAPAEIIATYGRIVKTVEWDHIVEPEVLLKKAQEYVLTSWAMAETIEVTAVDLARLDKSVASFNLGEKVWVYSKPHGLGYDEEGARRLYTLSEIEINFTQPDKDRLTLGETFQSLSIQNTVQTNTIKVVSSQDVETAKKIYANKEAIETEAGRRASGDSSLQSSINSATSRISTVEGDVSAIEGDISDINTELAEKMVWGGFFDRAAVNLSETPTGIFYVFGMSANCVITINPSYSYLYLNFYHAGNVTNSTIVSGESSLSKPSGHLAVIIRVS